MNVWLTCHFGWWQLRHSNAAFPTPYVSTNRIDAQGSKRFVEPTFVEVELVGEVSGSIWHEKIRQVVQNFLAEVCSVGHCTVRDLNQEIGFASLKQHSQHSVHGPLAARSPPLSDKMDETLGVQIAEGIAIGDQQTALQLGS